MNLAINFIVKNIVYLRTLICSLTQTDLGSRRQRDDEALQAHQIRLGMGKIYENPK